MAIAGLGLVFLASRLTNSEYLLELPLIMMWFFIWEYGDLAWLDRWDLDTARLEAGQLANAKIIFNENEGILLPTGIDTYKEDNKTIANNNKVFNIYDLAGNLSEWTNDKSLEIYNNVRGGNFCARGNNLTVANYDRYHSYISSSSIGIRVALYID